MQPCLDDPRLLLTPSRKCWEFPNCPCQAHRRSVSEQLFHQNLHEYVAHPLFSETTLGATTLVLGISSIISAPATAGVSNHVGTNQAGSIIALSRMVGALENFASNNSRPEAGTAESSPTSSRIADLRQHRSILGNTSLLRLCSPWNCKAHLVICTRSCRLGNRHLTMPRICSQGRLVRCCCETPRCPNHGLWRRHCDSQASPLWFVPTAPRRKNLSWPMPLPNWRGCHELNHFPGRTLATPCWVWGARRASRSLSKMSSATATLTSGKPQLVLLGSLLGLESLVSALPIDHH